MKLEGRTISYFLLTPQNVPQPAPPTDQQLAGPSSPSTPTGSNGRRCALLTVVVSAPKDPGADPDPGPGRRPEDVHFRKDSLSRAGKALAVEIAARDAAQAQAIAAGYGRARRPTRWAQVGRLGSRSATPTRPSPRRRPKVADAASSCGPAKSGGPCRPASGSAVIKVTSLTRPRPPTSIRLKPQMRPGPQRHGDPQKIYEVVQKYDGRPRHGSHPGRDPPRRRRRRHGPAGPVAADGTDAKGQPSPY